MIYKISFGVMILVAGVEIWIWTNSNFKLFSYPLPNWFLGLGIVFLIAAIVFISPVWLKKWDKEESKRTWGHFH